MKAFYIINSKNFHILLKKEYNQDENLKTLEVFLKSTDTTRIQIIDRPIITLNDNTIFVSNYQNITFVSIYNLSSTITDIIKIHDIIHQAIKLNTKEEITIEFLVENRINILLMLDSLLIDGIPFLLNTNVLSSFIQTPNFSDNFTENYIGKAKEYDLTTFENYLKETQLNHDHPDKLFYYNSFAKEQKEKILIDYIDELNFAELDKYNSFIDAEVVCKLKFTSVVSSKIDIGISFNYPYKIEEENLILSSEIKEKEKFLKNKSIELSSNYGIFEICRWTPLLTNENIDSTFKLPFKINVSFSSNSTVYF